jgi:hypothetical protein
MLKRSLVAVEGLGKMPIKLKRQLSGFGIRRLGQVDEEAYPTDWTNSIYAAQPGINVIKTISDSAAAGSQSVLNTWMNKLLGKVTIGQPGSQAYIDTARQIPPAAGEDFSTVMSKMMPFAIISSIGITVLMLLKRKKAHA